ncbi:hypothetical protein [Pseudemcibacter aquimaris]|uniref:hypothetical protein n=1 Tax=Pseudemcibacter aquimaris TaxID=2857064 RepID=UPI00201102C1|nr:hypothetical protein [Pseudemcibacter aquimaris]MCC3860133.1 hypothetical protein [Pseudemcibacter aquimaris]WDU57460.1 hypothetical protein KW060_09650 [Pseudemcibacter aquimaris]
MNKCTDIYSVEYYLQAAGKPRAAKTFSKKLLKKQKNFKILVRDDVKDSVYLVDA